MDKSYVSMEQKICPVCGTTHTYDCGILLDKRLKNSLDKYTTTGIGMCEEHHKQMEEGYVFLIEIDPAKSTISADGTIKPEDACRTGKILSVKAEVYNNLFTTPLTTTISFIDSQVSDYLESLMKNQAE